MKADCGSVIARAAEAAGSEAAAVFDVKCRPFAVECCRARSLAPSAGSPILRLTGVALPLRSLVCACARCQTEK